MREATFGLETAGQAQQTRQAQGVAAVEGVLVRLGVLGEQVEVATLPIIEGQQPVDIARRAMESAKLQAADVLLLDEPTNDLDVETLRALEDALVDFAGCAVVISHDRFFLDRICTHMLAFEGDAHVEWFEGNFEDYEADKIRRLGPDAAEPKRIKYKKFTR